MRDGIRGEVDVGWVSDAPGKLLGVGMPEAVEDRQGTAQCSADIEANGAQNRRKPILPSLVFCAFLVVQSKRCAQKCLR